AAIDHRRKEPYMRSLKWTSGLLAFGASVALWAGCDPMSSKEASSPSSDVWAQQDNFVDPTGGYTMTTEPTAFGDPQLAQIEAAESAFDVPQDSIPPDSTAFMVRIAWGQLENNPSATIVTDWSGSISVDQGALFVVRLLGFELLQGDHLI